MKAKESCLLLLGIGLLFATTSSARPASNETLTIYEYNTISSRKLLDRGEHGHYEGGEGGDDDDEGGSNMGSGSVISGTQNGCAVNFVDSLQAYFHCLQYSLGGQTVYLAYSIEQSGGKTIMNGAIVGPGVTSSTYIGIGSGSRMINTDAVIVSAISSSPSIAAYSMGGYSMSAFQATSGFLNNEASTLISAVAGDALVGGFSIFIPSGPSDNFVFAIGKVSSTNGMQRHYATGSTSINVASDSGTLNPNGLPVLNPGSGTSSGSGSAPKPSPSPAAINPNPKPAQPTTRPASKCALKIGKTTTTFSSCAKMRDGTAYFSLSGNTLSVGFKSTGTSGWAALAFGRNMIGANAVFAQAPSGASVKPYTAQMNGFTPSSFSSPGNGGFSKVKVGRSGKKLAATFTMPWPSGTSSVPLMLGKGSMSGSNMMVHRGIPKKYNLQKSTLSLTK